MIFPCSLKDIITGHRILGTQSFSYCSWRVLCHLPLASVVSVSIALSFEWLSPQSTASFYSGCFHNFFFVIFRSLIAVCSGMDFLGFILWAHSPSQICGSKSFAKFGKCLAIFSSALSQPCFLSWDSSTQIWNLYYGIHIPKAFFTLFPFSFLFLLQICSFLLFCLHVHWSLSFAVECTYRVLIW